MVQEFPARSATGARGVVHAVSNVSLQIRAGETVGIVGESGSGKSTLARAVLGVPPPKSGEVVLKGVNIAGLRRGRMRQHMRDIQMVFQDPYSSVDQKWTVSKIVGEPLRAFKVGTREERRRRVAEVLDLVGLDPNVYGKRRPRSLSGGQCQRVAIARALALSPSLIICDEAVSSLDVLIQAQVLNLFERLRNELDLAYLFIAHDLAMVKQVSDRVAVMYLGKLCEVGPADEIYRRPRHPYTVALLNSIPDPDPSRPRVKIDEQISGEPPSPVNPPSGCRFRTRCPRAQEKCAHEVPLLEEVGTEHSVACHFPVGLEDPAEPESVTSGSLSANTSDG
ncbi:MAG: ATP-binding cassette domain-containing protein [Acidimicrobiaceae bacterium]|nr:ATP-binding cassette domain-containing protein [Acidimicrobiaceae bacterium]